MVLVPIRLTWKEKHQNLFPKSIAHCFGVFQGQCRMAMSEVTKVEMEKMTSIEKG